MVGEITGRDTGSTAVEASLTGHTVFATIHTNDAPSTITRLVDMGIEPFLIAATLECVVAQRLVRTVCQECKQAFEPDEELEYELGDDARLVKGATLYFGKGCAKCHHTGYRGRMGLFEVMPIGEDLRRMIETGASIEELRQAAISGGMETLRECGLRAAASGRTTVEEVIRETMV